MLEKLFRRGRRERQRSFAFEDAVAFLVASGVDETDLRFGSIPEHHLDFIRATVLEQASTARPLVGLHVGNFVGVSLAAFVSAVRAVHSESTTIAIDPNVVTAGIENPQRHVLAVLERYGLLESALLVSSYSFEPTELSGAPRVEGPLPTSGVNALPQLGRLGVRFDVALIDGNHSGSTVSRELEWLGTHLSPGGLVFLDDVTDAWHEIRDLYAAAASAGSTFEAIGHDGRIGVLRFSPASELR